MWEESQDGRFLSLNRNSLSLKVYMQSLKSRMGNESWSSANFKTHQLSYLLLSHPEVQHQQTWTLWCLDRVYAYVEGNCLPLNVLFFFFWLIMEIHDCLKFKLIFVDGKFTCFKLVSVRWNSIWYPEFIKQRIKITKASSWRCQIKAIICGFMYFLFLYLTI